MVSECEDGTWECSCMIWIRTFPRKDCKHILHAKIGGKGVMEIDPAWTEKGINTISKAIGKLEDIRN
jgi:hypothetical protein